MKTFADLEDAARDLDNLDSPAAARKVRAGLDLMHALARALRAERAYHSNNTGEHAAERKAAMDALPKGWDRG